jgi:protoporphyrinogen oxidase
VKDHKSSDNSDTARPGGTTGNIAVVGGGIGGLVAAYLLAKAGARVTVFEASDQLGGLGTFFEYRNVSLERFYHCMLPSDQHLLSLLCELGLENKIYWKETSFGFIRGRRLFGLNTPIELLRFKPMSLVDRIRVGLTGLWGSVCSSRGLDDVTCVEWLTRLSGRRAVENFWKPMLQAKFGDRYHEVPALWFWTRFNREKGGKRECKGYIQGGYRRIVEALSDSIKAHAGIIKLQAPVESLDLTERNQLAIRVPQESTQLFDRVVFTAPVSFLRQATVGGRLAGVVEQIDSGIDMQGVVNAVFMLRRGFSKHYWIAAPDKEIPFQGIVESTTLLDKSDTAGVHLVYLMNYLHRSDPQFSQNDSEVLEAYTAGLKQLFPDFCDDDVIDRFVFRAPFVEPLYTTGYQTHKPPTVLLPGKLYLATTTQIYPEVTSWNGVCGLAQKVVNELLTEDRASFSGQNC